MNDYRAELGVMRRVAGLAADGLADPELRIPETLAMQVLDVSLRKTGNPALGLLAGARVEAADFGIVDAIARNARTFRQGLEACSRYMCLLDEGTHAELIDTGDVALWRLTPLGMQRPAPAGDFALMAALSLGYQMLGQRPPPVAVHVMHAEPNYAQQYASAFRCPIRWQQAENAIVMDRAALDIPLPSRNRDVFDAFNAKADSLLQTHSSVDSLSAQVQQVVINMLADGSIAMSAVSKRMNMSVATLRRRLVDEGTSHREILDTVRHARAVAELRKGQLSFSQIALALGFSSSQAFGRAFRRWVNESPTEYRSRLDNQRDDLK